MVVVILGFAVAPGDDETIDGNDEEVIAGEVIPFVDVSPPLGTAKRDLRACGTSDIVSSITVVNDIYLYNMCMKIDSAVVVVALFNLFDFLVVVATRSNTFRQ